MNNKRWTEEEDNKLYEYRKLDLTCNEIHKKMPNRSMMAIRCRIQNLGINKLYPFTDNMLNDLAGRKFDRLTVIERAENDKTGHVRWKCNCACGKKNIIVYGDALKNGSQVSCGCYRNENVKIYKGKIKTNTYNLENEYGIGICHNTLNKFYFDLDDYDKIKDYCWMEDVNGYIVTFSKRKCVYMHRLVMDLEGVDVEVDHIKHNTNDNRKRMLRIVTHSENHKNSRMFSNNTSGFTGVFYSKKDDLWYARITDNNEVINLYCSKNKEDAINARKEAEEIYFGEYSYSNSINYDPNE